MGDFRLNLLKFFTENCKTYRNLAKPLTPVTFFLSAKFINGTFNKFNNIYYVFYCREQPLKYILENNGIKHILQQINFTAFLEGFF